MNNYFILNKDGNPQTEYRLKIAQVLRGIADKEVYQKWMVENKELYEEVNNLVYEIKQSANRFSTFETFSRDLWGYDYKAIKSEKFSRSTVEEQLKLIDLLLGTQYWIDVSDAG